MKRRVIEHNGEFYPQYRGWFCWRHYKASDGRRPVALPTLKAAVQFIHERKTESSPIIEKVVWQE